VNVAPGATFEATLETGITGLVGTLELGIYEGDTDVATQALDSADINEIDATGIYVATRTAPDDAGQYVLVWSLDGTLDAEQVVHDELVVTANAPFEPPTGDTYATVDELARILKIRAPSAEQEAAMTRVLLAAAGEIDSEIDLDDDSDLGGWQLALAQEVNLERAVEHWRQQESPFGLLGLGVESGVAFASKDSWGRHAEKLAPLKDQWGLA